MRSLRAFRLIRAAAAIAIALQPAYCWSQNLTHAQLNPVAVHAAAMPAISIPSVQSADLAPVLLPDSAERNVDPPAEKIESSLQPSDRQDLRAAFEPLAKTAAEITESRQNSAGGVVESARSSGENEFSILRGEAYDKAGDLVEIAAPARADLPQARRGLGAWMEGLADVPAKLLPSPEAADAGAKANVRRMLLGSAAYKLGLEAFRLSVPLMALNVLGSATQVALLLGAFALTQAVSGSFTGALTDHFPAHRVLVASILGQASAISAVFAAGVMGLISAHSWILFPLYSLAGGLQGIIETARNTIPSQILGRDPVMLERYNAQLHMAYESTGTLGPWLLVAPIIAAMGPLYALTVVPAGAIMAALIFWRIKPSRIEPQPQTSSEGNGGNWWQNWKNDLRRTFSLFRGDVRLRWMAIAMILPQMAHRLLEDLLIPVFATRVLQKTALSARLLSASNFGELSGAGLLFLGAKRFQRPAIWLAGSAAGLLAIWAMTATSHLWALIPAIAAMSVTWAASDKSLLSDLQANLSEKDQPRVLGVISGISVLGAVVGLFLAGRLLDSISLNGAFIAIASAYTALAGLMWLAAQKINLGTTQK